MVLFRALFCLDISPSNIQSLLCSNTIKLSLFLVSCENVYWMDYINTFNTLGPRPNGCHFPDGIFKCISVNENVWISLKISLKFVPKVQIDNIPALIQTMAWRRPGDKPLSESMMVSWLTHICVTRPQWVKLRSRICMALGHHCACR